MTVTINTNVSALMAQNSLIKSNTGLTNTLQQLSTGLRINSAKDDAAGLAISVGMKNQIKGNAQAEQNIKLGMDFLNTAESSMEVITEDISRIRELCIQMGNEIYSTQNKASILAEIKQRLNNIDTQSRTANYNNIPLLDGSKSSLVLQFGAGSAADLNSIDIGTALSSLRVSTASVPYDKNGNEIKDKDGNSIPGLGIELNVTTSATPVAGFTYIGDWDSAAIGNYLKKLDKSIDTITSDRAKLGAFSNRLQSNYESLVKQNENLEQSKSSILDVDVAAASTQMVKYQILQRMSTSVLAQANSVPQLALQLLQ